MFLIIKKQDKIYDEIKVNFILKGKSRKDLKDVTIIEFLKEKPGYWKDGIKHVTLYKYFVEKIDDGRKIYLLRPTYLNKGIDFQVWVENMDGNKDKRPSHNDIFEDLKIKKQENLKDFPLLINAIDRVWNC